MWQNRKWFSPSDERERKAVKRVKNKSRKRINRQWTKLFHLKKSKWNQKLFPFKNFSKFRRLLDKSGQAVGWWFSNYSFSFYPLLGVFSVQSFSMHLCLDIYQLAIIQTWITRIHQNFSFTLFLLLIKFSSIYFSNLKLRNNNCNNKFIYVINSMFICSLCSSHASNTMRLFFSYQFCVQISFT